MATHTKPTDDEIGRWLAGYGSSPLVAVRGIPQGSVNSNFAVATRDRRYFLRIYEEQDLAGATADAALTIALARRGVPTPQPIARTDGSTIASLAGKPAALLPWVEGEMICQRGVTPEVAERVGAALARVHVAGVDELAGASRFGPRELFERLDTIEADARFGEVGVRFREALAACLLARTSELPAGLVHGDLFRDNVLWQRGELSALLDFESASRGAFVFDLAVTVLAWCYGDALDHTLVRAMSRGYHSVRALDERERSGGFEEARFAAVRFSITRVTDYAMRGGVDRVIKDYKRFEARLAALDALGRAGFEALL